jgi:hypothetical protein
VRRARLAALVLLWTVPAAAADRYAATNGSGSSCTVGSPCTLSQALSGASSGDTIIVNSGTYTAGFTISTTNVTVTTTQAVKDALTWGCGSPWIKNVRGQTSCGIPSGTDNRPVIQGRIDVNGDGDIIEYLRIRGAASPQNDIYSGVVAMNAENTIVRYNEIYNGNQGVVFNKRRLLLLHDNYIHDTGVTPSATDTHGVQYYAGNDGIAAGTQASSFANANIIRNNTFENISGDAVQEGSIYYGCGSEGLKSHATCGVQYLIIANNHMISGEEQCFDSKGTIFVRFAGNDCSGFGQGGISITWDPPTQSMNDFWIEGNYFHGMGYAYTWANAGGHCLRHYLWNNVIADNVGDTGFNIGAVQLCGGSTHYFVFNTLYNNTNSNGSSAKTWGLKNEGAGANVRNNVYYANGKGTGRGHMSLISGEDNTGAVGNYVNDPTTEGACGATCTIGTSTTTTCFTGGNCPGFVDINAANFQLQVGSPAIDAANAQDLGSHASLTDSGDFTPSIDALGRTRNSTLPDLGAFEYQVGGPNGLKGKGRMKMRGK